MAHYFYYLTVYPSRIVSCLSRSLLLLSLIQSTVKESFLSVEWKMQKKRKKSFVSSAFVSFNPF